MKHFIFAYGSLVNKDSRNKTSSSWREIIAKLNWYKRWWYFKTEKSNSTSVWIIKRKGSITNWVLFEIDESRLELFDEREFWYKRVELKKEDFDAIDFDTKNSKIWIYIVDKIELPNTDFPIFQSYVDIVINWYLSISKDFVDEFIKTTEWWNNYLINDRKNPVFKV